jgi:hypothetical protein
MRAHTLVMPKKEDEAARSILSLARRNIGSKMDREAGSRVI